VFEKCWVLQNVRASLVPACTVVLYGFEEHPFQRWGSGRRSVFEQLLEGGLTPQLSTALREVPLDAVGHFELLVTSGWDRLGTCFSEGIYRVLIEQRPGSRSDRLTPREFGVAELSARGWKSQRIADEMSIAPPTVRGAIDRCVPKLRLASSVQLPLLWSTLGSRGRCFLGASGSRFILFEAPLGSWMSPLTHAERELVERLLRGDSQRAMADYRGVSVRTVANQMSRLFEKLGVTSRLELVARLVERGAPR
jgi:DNA-binding CsgD family transcriptional regulator